MQPETRFLLFYFAIVAVFAILIGTIFYTVFIYDQDDDNLAGMADYELDDLFGNEIDLTGSEWTFEDFYTDEPTQINIGDNHYKTTVFGKTWDCGYIEDHWECSRGE